MKQVLQHLRDGRIELAEIPCPRTAAGHLLVQGACSLISPGTERSLVEFGQAGLIGKARAQPDKVRQVLEKIRTDGLMPTLETVFSRLDEPLPLGYCHVGRVVEIGRGVQEFSPGDRVVSNGPHAEMVMVPSTLAARVPDEVSDEAATFAVPGAIALHAIRLAQPGLGEDVVVVGLGLLGLLAVQLLEAQGCRVLGIDTNADRCALAESFGCRTMTLAEGSNPVAAAEAFTAGRGADAVLITASAKSDEIVHQAAQMCRKRGRIVLVGVVGLNLRRSDFYEKELSFQVSCSYGPGRYDPHYEAQARDYPLPYVRWTAARNFDAVLGAIARGRLRVEPLINRRIVHRQAAEAYASLVSDPGILGVILEYPRSAAADIARIVTLSRTPTTPTAPAGAPVVGVIGAGNFSKLVMLPALKQAGAVLHTIASAKGVSGLHAARKFGARATTTDHHEILQSPDINTVCIATRHDTHAPMVVEALRAGKHVFVEKPLGIDEAGLQAVLDAQRDHPDRQLMVGMNRRFAPHAVKLKSLLTGRSAPIALRMTVNAGPIPSSHWTHDPEIGGGRIIGEGCHFIDLLMFLVGHPIHSVQAVMMESGGAMCEDKMSINLTFADGSIGSVHYWANGPKSYPKETLEVFSEGRTVLLDNWRRLRAFGWPGVPKMRMRQDKGHRAEIAAFLERVRRGGEPLIPVAELALVARATFAAVRAAREGITITLSEQSEALVAPPESAPRKPGAAEPVLPKT